MLIALAIVLILAILGWLIAAAALNTNAICLFGHKYGDNGVCTRCGADKPSDEEKPDVGGAVITDGEEINMLLAIRRLLNSQYDEYGISPQAESAYTLTATVDSDDDDLSRLEWELQFVNPSSAWATDKTVTDYITINVAEDTHSATVSCMQPFGEQIKVVVKASYNLSASASCTIDYLKRATAINYSFSGSKGYVFITTQSDNLNNIVFTPVFGGIGTIEPTIANVQFNKLELALDKGNPFTGNFETECRNEFGYVCTTNSRITLPVSHKQSEPNCLSFSLMPDMLFQSEDMTSAKYKLAFNKALNYITPGRGTSCSFRVTLDIVYGGTVIQSGAFETSSFFVQQDKATPYVVVNGVSLSNSSLVF